MTFVPPSSIPSGSVTIVGTVAVSGPLTDAQLAARLPLSVTGPLTSAQLAALEPLSVSGPLTDAQLAARLPLSVSGPLTDAQLAARLPLSVSGPLTDAQLAARLPLSVSVGNFPADQLVHFVTPVSVTQGTTPWVVDGSATTQPVSVDSLPLPDGAATEDTLTAVNGAANDVALTAILQRDKMATP